ncbi:MAG: methyltransferase [Acidobacteria bacterium]|nr:methyltransferase [Acidobacteriota bacterium]
MSMALIRDYLETAGYAENALLAHFGLPKIHFLFYPVGQQGKRFAELYLAAGTATFLARVLIGGFADSRAAFGAHMPDTVFAAMVEAGLLERSGEQWQATGLLFPYEGFYVCSDRAFRGLERMPPDLEYVAGGADPTSVQFYEGMSRRPCRTLLEMGTGSGVGALLASRFADQVWALDINARSVAYARRNCELNNVENVTVLESNLFAAVDGMRFERIVGNLPFVPSTKTTAVFAAGGEDGEQILARFLEGCVERLEPGGSVNALVMGSDREDDAFETRLRRYLGAEAEECDVALFARKTMTPMDFAFDQMLLKSGDTSGLYRWIELFQRFRMEQMVLGTLLIQRRKEKRSVFTLRHTLAVGAGIADLERVMDWQTRCMSGESIREVLTARPKSSGNWEALSKHQMQNGQMATISYSIMARSPFEHTLECPPWVVSMAAKADGEMTVSQLLGMVQKQTGQPGEVLLRVFAQLVAIGVVEIL